MLFGENSDISSHIDTLSNNNVEYLFTNLFRNRCIIVNDVENRASDTVSNSESLDTSFMQEEKYNSEMTKEHIGYLPIGWQNGTCRFKYSELESTTTELIKFQIFFDDDYTLLS